MNKSSKIAAANSIVADMAANISVETPKVIMSKAATGKVSSDVAKAAASPLNILSILSKPAVKVSAKPVSEAKEPGLTERELAMIKAVASSDFADPITNAVPSLMLAAFATVANGVNKVNSPVPGIVASLKKKGVFDTKKVKGMTMVTLTPMGREYADLTV